jgi:hypothetical protein
VPSQAEPNPLAVVPTEARPELPGRHLQIYPGACLANVIAKSFQKGEAGENYRILITIQEAARSFPVTRATFRRGGIKARGELPSKGIGAPTSRWTKVVL